MNHAFVGRWTSEKNSRVFLEFVEDGSLRGSDGANVISSSWDGNGREAAVQSFMTTQRAVQGMESWVSRVRGVGADGDRLAVFDHSGEHIGDLTRDTAEATTTAPETTPDGDR